MDISKYIPLSIQIKTLYWVMKEIEIEAELAVLFAEIDDEKYEEAREYLEYLKEKWPVQGPGWFHAHIAELARAEAMLDFLTAKLD